MSEQKRKIGFTVACVNEFANKHNLSAKEAFQYLFQFKGIALIKESTAYFQFSPTVLRVSHREGMTIADAPS